MQLLPQLSVHMQNTLLGLATALRSNATCKNTRPRFWNFSECSIMFPKIFWGWELLLLDGEDDAIEQWLDAKHASPDGELVWESRNMETLLDVHSS